MAIFILMFIKEYEIIPALRRYVKVICTMDCDGDVDTTQVRVLPDACVELFLNYTSTPIAVIDHELHKRSIVSFRLSRYSDVQMRKGTGCIAICFYPGAAYRFFGLPMHTVTDMTLGLYDLWSQSIVNEIESELAGASSNDVRAGIVQQYLLRYLKENKDDSMVDFCLAKIRHSAGQIPLSRLAKDSAITQRHLARKFKEVVGLSPKAYLSMCRFTKSVELLKMYPLLSLTEVAYESGYYDQAHFIRAYKTFAGCTPGQVAKAQNVSY